MKKGMKTIMLVLAICLAGATASAWDWSSYCEALGDTHFIAKAGVGSGYALANVESEGYPVKGAVMGLVIPIQGEYLLKKVPLGITLNFRPIFGDQGVYKTSGISLMGGINYHVAPGPKNLDLYTGIGLGFYYNWLEYEIPGISEGKTLTGGSFAFDCHIGASYYFTKHFGINAEVGYPTWASMSVSFKF